MFNISKRTFFQILNEQFILTLWINSSSVSIFHWEILKAATEKMKNNVNSQVRGTNFCLSSVHLLDLLDLWASNRSASQKGMVSVVFSFLFKKYFFSRSSERKSKIFDISLKKTIVQYIEKNFLSNSPWEIWNVF